MKYLPFIIAGGGAALLLSSSKRTKKKASSIQKDDQHDLLDDILPNPDSNEVIFKSDMSEYKVGFGYKINVLDKWLNERRKSGKLVTVDRNAGWFYSTFVEDPATWIGELTGLGKTGGSVIYSGMWIMATMGIGIYASGVASASANLYTAHNVARTIPAVTEVLGPKAMAVAKNLHSMGFGRSRIFAALLNFGGTQSLEKWGVGKAIAAMSAGATGTGIHMAAATLTEMGIDEAFAPDIAASAFEAAADFTLDHCVTIGSVEVPIALLPASYQAVQEFNKFIMAYIIKFQKMQFED